MVCTFGFQENTIHKKSHESAWEHICSAFMYIPDIPFGAHLYIPVCCEWEVSWVISWNIVEIEIMSTVCWGGVERPLILCNICWQTHPIHFLVFLLTKQYPCKRARGCWYSLYFVVSWVFEITEANKQLSSDYDFDRSKGKEKMRCPRWSPIQVLNRPHTVNFSDQTRPGVFSWVWVKV